VEKGGVGARRKGMRKKASEHDHQGNMPPSLKKQVIGERGYHFWGGGWWNIKRGVVLGDG